MKVFWSWQSDTPGKIGRHFVRDALQAAIEQLKEAPEVEEPTERETRSAVHLDQDRKGISGSPDLARVILEKIEAAAVFVADVTAVGFVSNEKQGPAKKLINPNVAIELGYALHALTDRALLMVMNEHYGSRADLPFDLQSKAGPLMYSLAPDADRQTVAAASRTLAARLKEALEPFIVQRVEQIRQEHPFPEAPAKDGPARFRGPGEPIGTLKDLLPFGPNAGKSITLRPGPATWLRLMPTFDRGQTWTAEELQEVSRRGNLPLQPFVWNTFRTVRGADGIGCCDLPGDAQETNSLAFAFETGEVWAIDTWVLGSHPAEIFVGEIERGWLDRFGGYAAFLRGLKIEPPYRWIAGMAGVNHWRLRYPLARGQMQLAEWSGPECLAEQIVVDGTFAGKETPLAALLPFFEAIYKRCGMRRPDYLPRE